MKHVTVADAHAALGQGSTYIDVRSTREFAQGHPAGALNVPLMEPDEDTGMMQPNADFLRVVQAAVPADAPIFVGCQAGGRSMRAAQMLESFGFTDVTNVRGGFGGAPDAPGWQAAGLPVAQTPTDGHSYKELLAQADAAE